MNTFGATIGLCMIVRNESHIILRCLESVRPLVDYVLVEDTGSTDGTQAIVRHWLDRAGLPGEVIEEPWRDFAHNRSHALAQLRRNKGIDYALMIDADDQLVVEPGFDIAMFRQGLNRDFYMVAMRNGSLRFSRGQICSNRRDFRYRGVLHEFLAPPPGKVSSGTASGFHISVSREGARGKDPEKYRKDAELLEQALAKEKDAFLRTRYTFYLARSHHHAGDHANALKTYLKRAKLGGWPEEVFVSLYSAGKLQEAMGRPFEEVMATYLRAATAGPKRAEALHAASSLCRRTGKYAEGTRHARRGLRIPPPADGLFVETWIYDYGLLDEFAVNAYWIGQYQESLEACQRLLAERRMPQDMIARVTQNAEFAAAKIRPPGNLPPPAAEAGGKPLATFASDVLSAASDAGDEFPRTENPPRWCVFTSAGDQHNVLSWTDSDITKRKWELLTVFYGDSEKEFAALSSVSNYTVKIKGSKWQNLKKLYSNNEEFLNKYDFILVADDDLIWQSRQDIDRLFVLANQHDFWVCQPAFHPSGRISHPVTAWAGQDRGIRLVNFVEMTCPVFRLDKLKAFLDCYDGGLVGWGIDWWYCNVLGADFYRKFAIIDGITVTNPHDYQRRGGTREISKLQSNDERLAHWQRVMTQHNLKEYKSETVGYVSTEYSGQSEAKAPENAQASGLTPHPVPPVRWFSPAVDESKVAAAVPVVSEALVSAVSVTLPGNATESDRDPAAHIDDLARTLGELVGERPIALLDWPFYPNAGDHFIWLGEKILFRHRLRSEIIHECSLQKVDFLALSRLPAETVFVMHGGGNFGDLYPHHQRLREAVVAAFPDRRILVMPQTVFFQDPEQLERSARCMILHPDLHVIARDRGSLATLRSRMGLANCYLHIDAAFALQQIVTELVKNVAVAPRHDTVCLLRDDIEAATIAPPVEGVQRFDWMRAEDLAEFAANVPDIGAIPVARDTFRGPFDSYSWQRLCAAVRRLCDGRRIVTDRLHGHILAVMMGKHHEFHDNSYGKNAAFRETWTRGNPLMTFVRGAQRASDTLPAAGLPAHRVPSQRGITASAPVFLLTLHRGGGTLLTRILNCHPDLVIWGEHNGLFNRLAEMDDLATRVSFLMAPKSDAAIADYTAFSDHRLNNFDPWANPFDYDAFRHSCRDMIERIFTRGLRPGQRWGFKEIRYHRVPTVRYLEKLFPDARFIILRRDIQDVAVSGILAGWSLRWLENYRDKMPLAMAESIVRDVTYALLAIECGLDAVQADLGPRCLQLDYSQLADPALGFAARLFEFCGLVLSDPVIERIRKVQRVRAGGSNQAVCFGGVLSRDFIREEVARLAPELRAEIAGDGIDPARLLAQEGLGQYSFLVGDHYMRERGDGASSLFSYTGVRPMRASDPSVPANSEIRTELPPTHRADNLPARSIKSFPSLSPDDEYRRHEAEESTKTSALKRLGIIVPYRNRAPHLAKLLPHMISYFMRRGDTGVGEVTFIVVEQNDDLPFNRGGLLNAGFRAIETMVEYVCFHDVDYLPMWADYSYADMPTRIIWWGMHTRPIRVNNPSRRTQAPRVGLGAVSLFTNERFRAVNGYSNRFFGWGFEDKDLAARCALHSLAIEQRDGTFIPLDHDNAGFQDDGSKSPAWIENERRYAENQKAYRLHGTGQEGLSSLSVHTGAIQYARIAGLDGAESAEVMHLQVSFDDRRTGEAATRKLPGAITVRSSA